MVVQIVAGRRRVWIDRRRNVVAILTHGYNTQITMMVLITGETEQEFEIKWIH